jgi:uncharacterized membrane protein YdjX (TVP38/TMEM64 family)
VNIRHTEPNNSDVGAPEPSPRSRWPLAGGLLLILVASFALWRWSDPLITRLRDQDQIRLWLADFGPLAPLVSIALNVIQVLLAPVPGQFVGLANGYLFGVFWGTVYSLVGVMIGSAIAMGLGRWLGRPIVARFVNPSHLDRWDDLSARRGPIFFFLVFFLPLLPDDIICFAVGLSPLAIPYILALAALGRLPGLVASSWLGANASALSPTALALIGGGTLAIGGLVLRYQVQLEARLVRFADRWSSRHSN